jgi:hypothetical protein
MNSIRSTPARPFRRSTPFLRRSTSDRICFIFGNKHSPHVLFRVVGRCVSLTVMATDHILTLLIDERDKLNAAIEALQAPTTTEKTPGPGRKAVLPSVERDSKPEETVGPTAPAKRKMSAAGRRAIIAGAKKRSAAIKAAKAAAEAPTPAAAAPKAAPAKAPVPVKKGGLTAAGRKALSMAMKKRWAARKKAATKGKAT